MISKRLLVFVTILTMMALASSGQYGSFGLTDARQLGMGNTYATNSRELYAAGKNPSLLAYNVYDKKLDILFPNLSARQYNVNKVTNFFNDFFSQKPLDIITGIDGSAITRALKSNGKLYVGLQIGFLAFGYTQNEKIGSFSFAMKDYITGFLQLPKSLVEYNNTGSIKLSKAYIKDFEFQSSWTRAYELSYGRAFHMDPGSGVLAIYAGAGIKYLNGFMYNKIVFSSGIAYEDENGVLTGAYQAESVSAYSNDINFDNAFSDEEVISHVPFMHSVGKGLAFDLGITVLLDPGVKVGLSLTDAGFIQWKGKTKSTLAGGTIRIDSTLTIDDIDSLANSITIEKESDDQFRTYSPSAFHFGAAFMLERFIRNFPGEMNVAVEIHQGMASTMENPDYMRVALGIDWKPGKHWPVFLTGISNGQENNLAWSLGIGYELKFLEVYISSPNVIPVLEGSDIKTMSLSLCWHFVKNKSKVADQP